MNPRIALTVATALTLGTIGAGCASTQKTPAPLDPKRFQTLSSDIKSNITEPVKEKGLDAPKDAVDANEGLDLTEKSPVMFKEYSMTSDKGRICVVSDDDTYFAVAYNDTEDVMYMMGDGACSYEEADALVMGSPEADPENAGWQKGASLMGDVTIADLN